MIERFRDQFGTAGLVISVVALCAALAGGALATSGGGESATASKAKKGQRGPKGPKGATGVQGPAGANGKDGVNGAVGPQGPTGATGDSGANGQDVEAIPFGPAEEPGSEPCEALGGVELISATGTAYLCNGEEGSPWSAGGVLPSNATETGSWSASGSSGVISFSIPLDEELAGSNTHFIAEGGSIPTDCDNGVNPPSSPANPEADAGHLCIYVGFGPGVGAPAGIFRTGSSSLEAGAGKTGAAMLFGSAVNAWGTFAVTAL